MKDYRSDGTLNVLFEYDEKGNFLKYTEYDKDGKTPIK